MRERKEEREEREGGTDRQKEGERNGGKWVGKKRRDMEKRQKKKKKTTLNS